MDTRRAITSVGDRELERKPHICSLAACVSVLPMYVGSCDQVSGAGVYTAQIIPKYVGRCMLATRPCQRAPLDRAASAISHGRAAEGVAGYRVVYPGHTAGSAYGKKIGDAPTTTIDQEKRENSAFHTTTKGAFVAAVLADMPTSPTCYSILKHVNAAGALPLADRSPGDARHQS